jgi:hypothetical protein
MKNITQSVAVWKCIGFGAILAYPSKELAGDIND